MNRATAVRILSEQLVRSLELFESENPCVALDDIVSAARAILAADTSGRYAHKLGDKGFEEKEPETKPDGMSDRPALRRMRESVRNMVAVNDERERKNKKR